MTNLNNYGCYRIGYGFQDVRCIKREEDECSSKMITDMERLLESGTLTDVTIKCENRILDCHKAILSARLGMFESLYNGPCVASVCVF